MADVVADNPARGRFELVLDGGTAFIDYRRAGEVRVLTHAEVPVSLRGAGVGARLTAGTLELLRAHGERVIVHCPYIVSFIERHPQFADLIVHS